MKSLLPRRIGFGSIVTAGIAAGLCVGSSNAASETVPVRCQQGTIHAFLGMRSEDGRVVASGEVAQVVHGDLITTRATFRFTDGSLDDETTVLSQRHNLRLISDHHVQKGPFFPHPSDVLIDSGKGRITVRSAGKDGKDEVETEHLNLPPDLANGMVPIVVENIPPGAAETTVSMLVFTPKPRVVKLLIANRGEEKFSAAGAPYQGIHYEIKIELGGVAGVVAPLIGKQPPNIQVWTTAGQARTLVREQGPIYADGPVLTIEMAAPVWPDSPKAGK